MKRNVLYFGMIILALSLGGLFTVMASNGTPLAPETEDFTSISQTLRRFSEIKQIANHSGDWSAMVEVLANDPRGGPLSPFKVRAVQAMRNDPDSSPNDLGLLDYFLACNQFNQMVAQFAKEAAEQGKLVIRTPQPEPKETPVNVIPTRTPEIAREDLAIRSNDDLFSVPEIEALSIKTGLTPRLPRPLPEDLRPIGFKVLSIKIIGDLAYAQVDWEYGLEEDILVKKDGKWYLIGQKVLQWHGG